MQDPVPGVWGVQGNRASLRTGLGMQVGVAWHRLLTGRLDDQTKLAGPVISCEGTPFEGNAGGQWRFNPHVQSYTLAMDAVSPHAPLPAFTSPQLESIVSAGQRRCLSGNQSLMRLRSGWGHLRPWPSCKHQCRAGQIGGLHISLLGARDRATWS